MQGSQLTEIFNRSNNLLVNQNRLGELLAAVNHTVANCLNLLKRTNLTVLRIGQHLDDVVEGNGMIGHRGADPGYGLVAVFVGQNGIVAPVYAHALRQARTG